MKISKAPHDMLVSLQYKSYKMLIPSVGDILSRKAQSEVMMPGSRTHPLITSVHNGNWKIEVTDHSGNTVFNLFTRDLVIELVSLSSSAKF